jgi:hypothetical protein
MVKKILLLLLILCMISCFYTRTEYGNIRFKQQRFTIKPNSNSNAYKVIDTTKLYEIVNVINIKHNQRQNSLGKQFLKFYANGRVGQFDAYYDNDINSLNPKRAKMAYYNYDGENLVIQIYFEHPQGGGLIKKNFKEIKEDTLELVNDDYLYKYKILELPKEFLVYKPDW